MRLQINGCALEMCHLTQAGDNNTLTLVFLHEGLGCVAMWRGFAERLAQATGLNALLYSRAGYGHSEPITLPRVRDYLHREALDVLPQVLDAMAVKYAVLVGHSDGASIALLNAGGFRDPRVPGVVAMAPHVFNEPRSMAGVRRARKAYQEGGLRRRLARYHGDNVDIAFYGWNDTWLAPDFRDWNIEACLPAIEIPLLLIQGREDEYGTPRQISAIERQVAGPVDTLWLTHCGHVPHREREETTVEAIRTFVSKMSPLIG